MRRREYAGSMTDLIRQRKVLCGECQRVFTNTAQYKYGIRAGQIVRVCKRHPRSDKPWEGE